MAELKDRFTYVCKDCEAVQSSPIRKPLTKCQAYWKGRPCKGALLQLDPKPRRTSAV